MNRIELTTLVSGLWTKVKGYVTSAMSGLATVATSGSYDDLTDKPTIPAAQVNADWDAASGVAQILNKPTIPDTSDLATKSELNTLYPIVVDKRATQTADIVADAPSISELVNGQRIVLRLIMNASSGSVRLNLTLGNGEPTGLKYIKVRKNGAYVIAGSAYSFNQYDAIPLMWHEEDNSWIVLGHYKDTTYANMSQQQVTDGDITSGRLISPNLLRTNFYLKSEAMAKRIVTNSSALTTNTYNVLGTTDSVTVTLPTTTGEGISGSGGEDGFTGLTELMDESNIPSEDRPYITAIVNGQVANNGAQASYPVTTSVKNSLSELFTNEDFYDTYIGFLNNLGELNITTMQVPNYSTADEFLFSFICSTDNCSLTLPSDVNYGNGLDFDADKKASRKFQVSISDGIALYAYVDPSNS